MLISHWSDPSLNVQQEEQTEYNEHRPQVINTTLSLVIPAWLNKNKQIIMNLVFRYSSLWRYALIGYIIVLILYYKKNKQNKYISFYVQRCPSVFEGWSLAERRRERVNDFYYCLKSYTIKRPFFHSKTPFDFLPRDT